MGIVRKLTILALIQIPLKDSGSLRIALTILSGFLNNHSLGSNSFNCNQLHLGPSAACRQMNSDIIQKSKYTEPKSFLKCHILLNK